MTLKTGRELDEDLWVFERPLGILGWRIGTRMTVVRLADASLFLHSPVGGVLGGERVRACMSQISRALG